MYAHTRAKASVIAAHHTWVEETILEHGSRATAKAANPLNGDLDPAARRWTVDAIEAGVLSVRRHQDRHTTNLYVAVGHGAAGLTKTGRDALRTAGQDAGAGKTIPYTMAA